MPNCKTLGKKYQSGDFDISKKKRDSLEGCPVVITGDFDCINNDLTSLVGGPQKVDGYYYCSRNQLTDLYGCAGFIRDTLFCNNNKITSLVGIHKIIKQCPNIFFDCENITEGGIGLLLIANLSYISTNIEPFEIISRYLSSGTKGMMECSKELKAKGFSQYAKL